MTVRKVDVSPLTLLSFGEVLSVFRGGTDRKGNSVKEQVGYVEALFDWGGMSRSMGDFDRQESAVTKPTVFVVKGSDLMPRDRVERANGERYSVVGHALWDQSGELSIFGRVWVMFQLESMNG